MSQIIICYRPTFVRRYVLHQSLSTSSLAASLFLEEASERKSMNAKLQKLLQYVGILSVVIFCSQIILQHVRVL